MNHPFKKDPLRTAIALAYTNEAFIADSVMTRAPVGAEEFKYTIYNKADRFTIPDTRVDRKGSLNQVEFGGTEQGSMTQDYGLEDVIPLKDIKAAKDSGFDIQGNATELLTELVMLQREQRVAGIVHNGNTYSLKETLAAGDKWTAATGKPIDQITDAMEQTFMRPNVMVLNGAGLLALRKNPQIVKAYHGNTGEDGLVPVAFLRDLFELEIMVGRAKYNAANPGQTLTMAQLWQAHCALIYQNPSALPNKGLTFGLTAQYGTRISRSKQDPDIGLHGAVVQQVGESVKELVLAEDCGYLIQGVL